MAPSLLFLVAALAVGPSAPPTVAEEILFRGEPVTVAPVAPQTGETLAHAVYGARASAVVAISASDGQGSGALLREDGFVLTCAHVVGEDPVVSVMLQSGASWRGRVIAADSTADLALLKLDGLESAEDPTLAPVEAVAKNLPWIPLGDLDTLAVGDPVIAIGHPKGFGWTLNEGIVSNLFVFRDGTRDPGIIQTQVPLNPGNSGGPLLDRTGHLVGVVSQGDPGAQALNWCISARAVKGFLLRHADAFPPATLSIDASPSGAKVLVDGFELGSGSHVTTHVAAGAHVVSVTKPGMGEISTPVVVLQRENASVRVRLLPAGTLAIAADAADVGVYVDGVFRGIAPVSLDIAAGSHTITGMKTGSLESHATATVAPERETEVSLSNVAQSAWISVTSFPAGAEVIIDGERAGVTPVADHLVEPGRHVVDVRRNESSRRVVVDLSVDARRELQFNLDPSPSSIDAAAKPAIDPATTRPRPRARIASGVGLSIAGAVATAASAAVLLTQKDHDARLAATSTMAAGAAGLIIGPALFVRDLSPHESHKPSRVDKDSAPAPGPAAGLRASISF